MQTDVLDKADFIGGITNNLNLGLVLKPSSRVDFKN